MLDNVEHDSLKLRHNLGLTLMYKWFLSECGHECNVQS